jgi:hypothetical protein
LKPAKNIPHLKFFLSLILAGFHARFNALQGVSTPSAPGRLGCLAV